jgi:hypothetical protein
MQPRADEHTIGLVDDAPGDQRSLQQGGRLLTASHIDSPDFATAQVNHIGDCLDNTLTRRGTAPTSVDSGGVNIRPPLRRLYGAVRMAQRYSSRFLAKTDQMFSCEHMGHPVLPGDDPVSREFVGKESIPEGRVVGVDGQGCLDQMWGITQHAPPFQISHGTAETVVPLEHSERLHSALVAAGVDSELFLLDGYRHGFLNAGGRIEGELAGLMDDGRLLREVARAHPAADVKLNTQQRHSASTTSATSSPDTWGVPRDHRRPRDHAPHATADQRAAR